MATENQLNMLWAIARSEYQPLNGGVPESFEDTDWVWAEFIIRNAQDKGTFTSMLNEGWVQHNGIANRKEACVRLTEEGFEVYRQSLT